MVLDWVYGAIQAFKVCMTVRIPMMNGLCVPAYEFIIGGMGVFLVCKFIKEVLL